MTLNSDNLYFVYFLYPHSIYTTKNSFKKDLSRLHPVTKRRTWLVLDCHSCKGGLRGQPQVWLRRPATVWRQPLTHKHWWASRNFEAHSWRTTLAAGVQLKYWCRSTMFCFVLPFLLFYVWFVLWQNRFETAPLANVIPARAELFESALERTRWWGMKKRSRSNIYSPNTLQTFVFWRLLHAPLS